MLSRTVVRATSLEEYESIMSFFETNRYQWNSGCPLRNYGWQPDYAYEIPNWTGGALYKTGAIKGAMSVTEYLEKNAPEFLIREVNLDNLSDLL